MKNELTLAIKRICAEKNLPEEAIIEILESALVSAYKKDHPLAHGVQVTLNPDDEELRVFAIKEVVEFVEEGQEELQIPMLIAMAYDPDASIGKEVSVDVTPKDFGRIAAQTAKQVLMQRIKELEREIIYREYNDKVNEILSGQIRKVERGHVIINLGQADGILPYSEQIPRENYYSGQRVRVLLKEVARTSKGPQLVLSRAHVDFIKRLFEIEIPEIYSGSVEIKNITREAGRRTKVSVAALQDGVDPVGSCVGQRGSRIQVIMGELGDEKIDIIAHDADPATYIANSLKPAQINQVVVDKENRRAVVIVAEDQLSMAIGREGQNVRLASQLVGWELDIKSPEDAKELLAEIESQEQAEEDELKNVVSQLTSLSDDNFEEDDDMNEENLSGEEQSTIDQEEDNEEGIQDELQEEKELSITDIKGVGPKMAEKLIEAGFDTVSKIVETKATVLSEVKGVSLSKAESIIESAKEIL